MNKKKFRKQKKIRSNKFVSKIANKRLKNKKVLRKEKPVFVIPEYKETPYRSVFFDANMVEQRQENRRFLDDGEVFFRW